MQGFSTSAMEATDGWRDSNASYSALIVPPGVGTTVYWKVVHRGMGGKTERL